MKEKVDVLFSAYLQMCRSKGLTPIPKEEFMFVVGVERGRMLVKIDGDWYFEGIELKARLATPEDRLM